MRPGPRLLKLKPFLDSLLERRALEERIPLDPVHLPRAYRRPEDAELVALLAASLAYGRAEVFIEKLRGLLGALGPRPSQRARRFDPRRDARLFRGFVYRFNVASDVAALFSAAGQLQERHGSLERAFTAALPASSDLVEEERLRSALASFVSALREAAAPGVARELGPFRGLDHLLPDPLKGGACKRLLLFLRWMVRRDDPVDLGLWSALPARSLVIPLDTHVARVSRCLGLTGRADLSWRTAAEVTRSLRLFDADDPVKYDFALCHFGMSGSCPSRRSRSACRACVAKRSALGSPPA